MPKPERIFELALRRPPSARLAYLRRACAGDARLLAELRSLLDACDRFPRQLALSTPAAADARPLAPGSVLGKYELERELGRGGMGVVFLARDRQDGRAVALKVLPDPHGSASHLRARLRREARLLAEVRHPMIAALHALEREGKIDFLVMEYVPGPTLSSRLAEGPLAEKDALAVGRAISLALEAAHGRGIAHLDLKPDNVLLPPGGGVKVLDFGLSRTLLAREAPTASGAPRHGLVFGTPGYASPEQLRGRPGDARSDLFSFGCVLFECLAGRPAFPGRTAAACIEATRRHRVRWSALPAGLSSGLRGLLDACLSPTPRRRPAGFHAVRRLLEEEIETGEAPRADDPARLRHAPGDASPPDNLPIHLDRFVGRSDEKAQLLRLLRRERLVTLVGPGGCGKSRLAMEAARSWLASSTGRRRTPDGVRLVELAAAPRTSAAVQAIASALGVRERRGLPLRRALADHLRDRRLLLILDNCEHLPTAFAATIEAILADAPRSLVLATSRTPLDTLREQTIRLGPLPVPATAALPAEIRRNASARLFLDRAASAVPAVPIAAAELPDVAAICRRLDGLPLAIELAAARVATMSLHRVRREIDAAILPTPGESETAGRHRTLEDLVAWSERQLSPEERRLFRRLAVFSSPFPMAAAEAISPAETAPGHTFDLVSALVRHSLLERLPSSRASGPSSGRGETARYRMLEVVRRYAWRRMTGTATRQEARRRHRDHFLELVQSAARHAHGPEQAFWLDRLEAVRDDLRAAVEWSARCDPTGPGPQLAASLGWYWSVRGHWSEGIRLLGAVVASSRGAASAYSRLRAALWAGNLELNRGALAPAERWYEKVRRGATRRGFLPLAGSALLNLGAAAILRGDLKRARAVLEEAIPIHRKLNQPSELAILYLNLGVVAEREQALAEAARFYRRSLALREKLGDRWAVALSLNNLGVVAEKQGRLAEAAKLHRKTLRIRRRLGDRRGLAETLHNLAAIEARRGRLPAAARGFLETLPIRVEIGDDVGLIAGLEAIASVTAGRQPGLSARLLGCVDHLRRTLKLRPSATSREDRTAILRILTDSLPAAQLRREMTIGRSLTREQAIALSRSAASSRH